MFHDPTPNTHEDSLGIARVRAEDQQVVNRYAAGVRHFCRTRTQSPEDADDAAQDTFIRFLRRSDQHIRNPEAWLITVATRACIDINRRRQRDQRLFVSPSGEELRPVEDRAHRIPDPKLVDPEQLIVESLWINQILRKLNERDRVIVTHLYLMGRSLSQLASFLGVSYEYAKVLAQRARRHVRALLADLKDTSST